MKSYIGMAWLFLSLASTAAALAIQEQQLLAERGSTVERVQPGYTACTSELFVEQFSLASHRQQVAIMMQDECLPTENLAEYPFVVLNEGSQQVNKIRLMLPDDQYADLFVPVAAVTAKE